jgi:hypothetical protein
MIRERWLIDANPIIERYSGGEAMKSMAECIHDEIFVSVLKNAPTVDAVEVVHGHWVLRQEKDTFGYINHFCCSQCGKESKDVGNYCSSCGADMRGDKQ